MTQSGASLPSILDLSFRSLLAWLRAQDIEPYRAGQILHSLKEGKSFGEMLDLPGALRARLAETFRAGHPTLKARIEGEGADRCLFQLDDGEAVESVQIGPIEDYTICLSTQVGCGLRCAFCASGKYGLTRNLTSGEIIGQILGLRQAALATQAASGLPSDTKADGWPRHIVYMGMGEPFHNYRATLDSIQRLIDPLEYNFGARRITVSTVGIIPEIYRFAEEDLQVGLAVSLHAPNSDLRKSLMPVEEVYPLAKLLRACRYYIEKTGRRLTFEYILLAGVNDSPREAKRLAALFEGWKLIHINLIRFNPIGVTRLKPPTEAEAKGFLKRLNDAGVAATLRKSPGKNIHAACGQLRGLEFEKAAPHKMEPLPAST